MKQGLNRVPSDPEANDIPMCHNASSMLGQARKSFIEKNGRKHLKEITITFGKNHISFVMSIFAVIAFQFDKRECVLSNFNLKGHNGPWQKIIELSKNNIDSLTIKTLKTFINLSARNDL